MIEIYIDGLTEPRNPGGIATWGFVVTNDNIMIQEHGVVGEGPRMSNNVAEYASLIAALKWIIKQGIDEPVTICSDSQLVVNQMNGMWSVRKGLYIDYYEEAMMHRSQVEAELTFKWVPREQNKRADAMSRVAYEQYCNEHNKPIKYSH